MPHLYLLLAKSLATPADVVTGPWCIQAVQVFEAGAVTAQAFESGANVAEVFEAGATAAEVGCK